MQLSVFVAEKSGETKNTWFKNTNTTITTTTSWESESRTACCRCVPAKKPEPHPFLLSPKKQRQPSKFCKMQQSCTHWEMTWSHDPRRVGFFLCPVRVLSVSKAIKMSPLVVDSCWFLQSVTTKTPGFFQLVSRSIRHGWVADDPPGQRPCGNGFSQLVTTWPFLL